MSTARKTLAASATAALAAAAVTAGLTGQAEAIPAPQKRCAFNFISNSSTNGWQQLGLSVSVNNGTSARQALVQLAGDTGVDTLAEVRVGYSVDGGPVQEHTYGPCNFANHDEYWETRSRIGVVPLARGRHTITPYWRISGMVGKQGQMTSRCFTVESRTS